MTTQFKVGDRVIRRSTGTEHVITNVRVEYNSPYRIDASACSWYSAEELTPAPPTPKRVEVVTETKTVVKEVWIRLSPEEARCFVNADTTLLDMGTNMKAELTAALTE